jgi:hypothetical protein
LLASDKLTSLDTLRIIAEYKKTDSLNVLKPQTDTLNLCYYNTDSNEKSSKSKKKDKGKDEEVKPSGFELKASIKVGQPVIPIFLLNLRYRCQLKKPTHLRC